MDKSSHYLELAVQYFERSEQANNPQIRGKLRKLAHDDLLPNLPSFIRRVCSGYALVWGVLRTQSV